MTLAFAWPLHVGYCRIAINYRPNRIDLAAGISHALSEQMFR